MRRRRNKHSARSVPNTRPPAGGNELREDGGFELREDGGKELRE
jgi:hypothetical protein